MIWEGNPTIFGNTHKNSFWMWRRINEWFHDILSHRPHVDPTVTCHSLRWLPKVSSEDQQDGPTKSHHGSKSWSEINPQKSTPKKKSSWKKQKKWSFRNFEDSKIYINLQNPYLNQSKHQKLKEFLESAAAALAAQPEVPVVVPNLEAGWVGWVGWVGWGAVGLDVS